MTKRFVPAGWNKGKGKAYAWLLARVDYQGDDCLPWPFSLTRGYGALSHEGRRGYAHRFMCELIHGAPPTSLHEAAHSCGRGDQGCVNPKHISWKTKSGNSLDCSAHGTQARSHDGTQGRLTSEQATEIRNLKGVKLQREIAAQFDISESTVSDIWLGRTHTKEHKRDYWTEDEDTRLMGGISLKTTIGRLSEILGRSEKSINARLYRIRLAQRALPPNNRR